MSQHSPQDALWQSQWLPSPQYSESGWPHTQVSPGYHVDYFHHNTMAPAPSQKAEHNKLQQARYGVQSQAGNITPGATPQTQAAQWQPAVAPYRPGVSGLQQQQVHPSLSGSFMQQFGDANLDESFMAGSDFDLATSGFPLQTPPPTRDSTKRKAHQPRLPEFATPPTIRKRPAPRPATAGSNKTPDPFHYGAQASPFAFTPLQFSPPSATGFPPSGPISAPTQPGSVFWDPASISSFNSTFPTIAEDPFAATPPTAPQALDFSSPAPLHHRYAVSESFQAPPMPPTARPHTAQPSSMMPMATPAGIDPNMLRTNQVTAAPTATSRAATSVSTPYATQKAALQRERAARIKRTPSRPGIQRSTTDPMLTRSESPLKRQKSNAHAPMSSTTASPMRREVVLTVDERGNASTQVVGDLFPPGPYALTVPDEEETDDDLDGSMSTVSDAQAAIKQIRHK